MSTTAVETDALRQELEEARRRQSGLEQTLEERGADIARLAQELEEARRQAAHLEDALNGSRTQTRALREELTLATERAARLEQSLIGAQRLTTIGKIAAQMAHEFKNILMIIMGRAEWALSEDDPELADKALHTAVASSQRGADIVKGLLSYAKGRQMESKLIRADKLLDRAVDLIAWSLPKCHVQLVRDYDGSGARVRVVPVRMDQVFLNLILNARNAMDPGGGRLIVAVRPAETEGYVAFSVQDTGCGIPNEHLERIFDPFFSTRPRPQGDGSADWGTGLGLPVSRDLVRQAGGEIHVESTPGEGSTFAVLLPIVEETQ